MSVVSFALLTAIVVLVFIWIVQGIAGAMGSDNRRPGHDPKSSWRSPRS